MSHWTFPRFVNGVRVVPYYSALGPAFRADVKRGDRIVGADAATPEEAIARAMAA